jgi:hypothetical protein
MNKLLLLLMFLFCAGQLLGQAYRVSGFVIDSDNSEVLIGASVVELHTNRGTATNNKGYFSLPVQGTALKVSFIGYSPQLIQIQGDTVLEVKLVPGKDIGEIVIQHQRFKPNNISHLSNKELMQIPSLAGKPDVLKALQFTPGIEPQGEGTSVMNVRGGSPGENLYMIDDVPLIYVNHIGGFYSVFNPDMINHLDVYKSSFPAKYGGKLSSVVAITQREGNKMLWKGNFSLGVTDASFALEGPLVKDKMSLIVTGRKTLIELPLAILTKAQNGNFFMYYGFHDLNAKWTYKPDKRNSLHAHLYTGDDYIDYYLIPRHKNDDRSRYKNKWGNYLVSGKWSNVVNDRLFMSNTLSTTRYRLQTKNIYIPNGKDINASVRYLYKSTINDLSLRSDWTYSHSSLLTTDFGMKLSHLHNVPNHIEYSETAMANAFALNSFEATAYQNTEITITPFLKTELGLRFVNYFIKDYRLNKLEPRLSLKYLLGNQQIGVDYQDVYQFTHLMLTSGAIFNNEVWISADNDVPSSRSQQYGLCWNADFIGRQWSAEISLYHKYSDNLATFKEGYSSILGDGNWKSKVETGGIGKSRGVEFILKKNTGTWNGFIAYTLSRTTRQFPGINKGEEYLFDYDRPHSLSIVINHSFNEKLELNIAWVYQTGLPYTPVIARHQTFYYGEPEEALVYGARNSARMEDYHRLDAALKHTKTGKRGRRVEWSFSVYNLYNRKNANSYYYNYAKNNVLVSQLEELPPLKQYQNSFFPIIPNISYRVYFDDVQFRKKNKQALH